MEIKELKLVTTERVVEVICDSCGKSCSKQYTDMDGNIHNAFEYLTMSAHWGYFSNKDMTKYTAHICEKCVDEKFSFVGFRKEEYFPISG
jgi:uncharacterized cysteine cluster protein YcgN (CxxCxxCC family)